MQKKISRAERILEMIVEIRERSGELDSKYFSEKYQIYRKLILVDLQLAAKKGFVKHDYKLKKYIYTGGEQNEKNN